MKKARRILFLLSVPRSGSTVVQDHLAKKLEGAVTSPETWILPFVMAARNQLSFSPIGLEAARMAEKQLGPKVFDKHLFVGIESFFSAMLDDVPGAKVFVEKTPRNVFYDDEISEFLPSAKKIVLVRHPLDVALSSFDYFCQGRPNLARVSIDLHQGVDALAKIVRAGDGILLRFEDFIADQGKSLQEELREAGFVISERNSLYEHAALRGSGMGDEKFKATKELSTSNSFRHASTKISLVTYYVLSSLLMRESYRYFLETVYGEKPEDVRRRLRKNVNKLGVLDLLALVGGGLSSLSNLKVAVFKFRHDSLMAYLR